MLAGDFTAFASPACNGGVQRTLTGGFVNNRIDPSKLNSVALNFLKHVPVSTDPCGKLQYGIPNNSTEHQALAKVDYTINSNSSLFARYFYAVYDNPATYDGSNVADAQPHQPEQPGALARPRPQPGAVGVDAQLAARDVQQDAERSAAAAVFQRNRSRLQGLPAWCPGTWAQRSPATASRSATAAPTPATSTPPASRSPTTSTSSAATISCRSAATGFTRGSRRSTTGPTNGAVHVQRAGARASRWPTS